MIELSRGLSFVLYTYEGGPTRFTVPFPYIAREHIRAFVGEPDAARAVSVSWVDASTIEIPSQDGVLDAPYTVTIRRFTPIDALLVNYKEGANLPARDLSKSFRQLLYAHQELAEFGGGSGLPGGGPGNPGGDPDLNAIIEQLLRSPALQDLLTRIDLIDVNAEAILEEIMRSHEFFDVQRDYGDKISTATHEIGLLTEGNKVIAQQIIDLFARVDYGEQSSQARFLEVNRAIADDAPRASRRSPSCKARWSRTARRSPQRSTSASTRWRAPPKRRVRPPSSASAQRSRTARRRSAPRSWPRLTQPRPACPTLRRQ